MRRLNCHRPLGAQQALTPEKELLTDASWENDRKEAMERERMHRTGYQRARRLGSRSGGGVSCLLGDLISRMSTIPGLPTAPTTVTRTQHKLSLPIKPPPQDAKYDDIHQQRGAFLAQMAFMAFISKKAYLLLPRVYM